jgi:hypothetical protein
MGAACTSIGFVGLGKLALDAARRLGIPLPTAARADEVLEQAVALGYERRNLAALFPAPEDIATGDP